MGTLAAREEAKLSTKAGAKEKLKNCHHYRCLLKKSLQPSTYSHLYAACVNHVGLTKPAVFSSLIFAVVYHYLLLGKPKCSTKLPKSLWLSAQTSDLFDCSHQGQQHWCLLKTVNCLLKVQHQTQQPWAPALPTQDYLLLPISTPLVRKPSSFAEDRNSPRSSRPAFCFPKSKPP